MIVTAHWVPQNAKRRTKMSLKTMQRAGLALVWLAGIVAPAATGQWGIKPPPVPSNSPIAVPTGNVLFLVGQATGTQGYICLPDGNGAAAWIATSRPQATLSVTLFGGFNQQILTHFLSPDTNPNQNTPYAPNPLPVGSPTWQSSFDSSMVWGYKTGAVSSPDPGDPACPNSGAIKCLLLQAIGSVPGPSGLGILTNVTYIQRLYTTGGVAPSTGCSALTDVGTASGDPTNSDTALGGNQALVPYTANYYFYTAQK
jgi:hypothetical protein